MCIKDMCFEIKPNKSLITFGWGAGGAVLDYIQEGYLETFRHFGSQFGLKIRARGGAIPPPDPPL